MQYWAFCELTLKEQVDAIRGLVDDGDSLQSIIVEGHSEQLHCGQTANDILDRVMHELKTCSSFVDKACASANICDAIYYRARDIANWVTDPFRKREKTFSFSVDFGEPVGTGITTDLKEKETHAVQVVLERSFDETRNAGRFFFFVKTAYPDLKHESARETGRTFGKDAQAIYNADQDALFKGFWTLKTAGYSPSVGISTQHGKFIDVPFRVNGSTYSILFNEDSPFHRFPHVSKVSVDKTGRKHYTKVEKIDDAKLSAKEKQAVYDVALDIQEKFNNPAKEDSNIFDNYLSKNLENSKKSLDNYR